MVHREHQAGPQEGADGRAPQALALLTGLSLTVEHLRKRIQIRLADRRLPPILVGIYKMRPGTGRICSACLRAIGPTQTEYEVDDRARDVLIAHEICYTLWRAESIAFAKANDPRQQPPRS